MPSIASTERALLAARAEQLGPAAPTLCEGWTVRDLVVHLLAREGSPTGLGEAVPRLGRVVSRLRGRDAEPDFAALVQALHDGPPPLSPLRLPAVGSLLNSAEFFIHHEDLRRAQPDWTPRVLPTATEDVLWRWVTLGARVLLRRSPVGVTAERADTGATAVLRRGDHPVVLRGNPSELLLFLSGRGDHAVVELLGEPEDVTALKESGLAM